MPPSFQALTMAPVIRQGKAHQKNAIVLSWISYRPLASCALKGQILKSGRDITRWLMKVVKANGTWMFSNPL